MNQKYFLLGVLMIANCAFASNDVVNTQTQNTVSQNTTVNTSHIGTAKDWDLSDPEWHQYMILMDGSSEHYYKNLSPPEVLGINANNDEELRHYAEVAAKLEHDKLERELRFNAAFHEAATRLYSAEPIIKPFDYTPFTPIPKN
jgi:integrating conjugative element protein (TIGR03759 family)